MERSGLGLPDSRLCSLHLGRLSRPRLVICLSAGTFPVPRAVPGQCRPSINARGRKGRVDGCGRAAQRLALGTHGSTMESTRPRPQALLRCQEMWAPSKHPGETPQGTGRKRVCPPLFNSTLLSLKLLHHLFCSKIQRLCLLCPKSPPRRPTSPPESAQPLLRQPPSPGPPKHLSRLGKAPALAGAGYVPP